jgi:hypothetical protein
MLYFPRRRRVSVKLNVVLNTKGKPVPPLNIHPCVFKRLRERNISNVLL